MLEDVIQKTKQCRFNFRCLEADRQYPVCSVAVANGNNVLFVKNDTDANCKYSTLSGSRPICACPTHYALHRKQSPHMTTPILSREEYLRHEPPAGAGKAMPQTVEEAVQILMKELSLKDKVAIANVSADDVGELTSGFVNDIRNAFDLGADNKVLLSSCSKEAGFTIEHPDDAAVIILARLVMALVKTHKLGPV